MRLRIGQCSQALYSLVDIKYIIPPIIKTVIDVTRKYGNTLKAYNRDPAIGGLPSGSLSLGAEG